MYRQLNGSRTIRFGIRTLVVAVMVAASLAAGAQVPANLVPPQGNVELVRVHAIGVQFYRSVPHPGNPSQFDWLFIAPQANLYEGGREWVGRHYVGPTWEWKDRSRVVGAKVAAAPSPNPGSIPQLLLQAVAHRDPGMLINVTYIQRLDTMGGIAPASSPSRAGIEAHVPYTATYVFFVAGSP